MLKDSWRSW